MSEQFLYFLQQRFNGVTLGSTNALIAIGYPMVYGINGMINFAHGEVYMIGSYVSFMIIAALMMMGIDTGWLLVAAGFVGVAHGEVYMIGSYVSFMIIAALMMMGIDTGWLLVAAGFVGAIVIASAYGWSIERVAYRPVRNSKRLIALISAIGMSIFLQNYVSLTEGSRDVALPSLFNGQWVVGHSENFSASITTMQAVIWILISAIGMSIFLQNYVSLTEGSRDVALPSLFNGQWVVGHSENFSASITTMQAVIWIVTFLAMLALTICIRYSRMGRACRACAEDLKMASLLGINTDRVIALTSVCPSSCKTTSA